MQAKRLRGRLRSFSPVSFTDCGKIFLDCGAYGFWQRKQPFPFDSYFSFVVRHADLFGLIALPDVINDPQASFINYRTFLEKAEKFGVLDTLRDRLVWTYHLHAASPSLFKEMVSLAKDFSLTWAAGGGLVASKASIREKLYFVKWLADNTKDFKLHLWGVYQQELLEAAKPDSADTSLPSRLCATNRVLYWNGHRLWFPQLQSFVTEGDQRHFIFNNSVNALRLAEMSFSQTWGKDFKFWIVCSDFKSLQAASPFIRRQLKDSILMSFFNFL